MNGVLDEYKSQIQYTSPLDADKIVVWQDCVGSFGKLIQMSKVHFPKPVYTLQHGRRASRDYDKPLKRPFQSSMFLAWGEWDYQNMKRLGHPVEKVGCPLNSWIKPKVSHKEKVILFVPVNTGKEEPDNIRVYTELLKIKQNHIQDGLTENYDKLRDQWNVENINKNTLCDNFTLLTKTLPWHDQKFYTEGVIRGYQDSERNNRMVFDLLRNVDLVVGLDEGTTELFACAHDVPVIVVDGFEYRWKEGCRVKPPRTKGIQHCTLDQLDKMVDKYLTKPELLREERHAIAENEMSVDSIPDSVSRIHEIIGSKL
jgi:hypothetical protein